MNKKILGIILLLVLVMCTTACGNKSKLNKIVDNFNNSETVKSYKEYGYKINASSSKDSIIIESEFEESKRQVEFKLDGNILSNENIPIEDLMTTLILVNAVGQTYGYEYGELSKNLNAFPDEISKYTVDKEGLELVINDDNLSLKMDISKKVPLIDMDNYYLKTDDLDMIKQIMADGEGGNQSGKNGNIAYDVFINENESTIIIGQDKKLSDSAYKSILSAIEVIYGKDTSKHFQEIYPSFKSGKTEIEAFTIETNYKLEDQEDSMFKDTEVVQVIINNEKIK